MATNRLPAASRKRHDNSTTNLGIGARSQAACGSTLTLATHMMDSKSKIVRGALIAIVAYLLVAPLPIVSNTLMSKDGEATTYKRYGIFKWMETHHISHPFWATPPPEQQSTTIHPVAAGLSALALLGCVFFISTYRRASESDPKDAAAHNAEGQQNATHQRGSAAGASVPRTVSSDVG